MIIRNSVRCLTCNDEIESRHRHDFVPCRCGAVFVDGGKDYLRRGWDSSGPGFEETSTVTDDEEVVDTP